MARIVISGYYGFGNTGDEAVLAGILATFRKLGAEVEVTVLSADPERTKREHPGADAIHRMKPAQVIRAIWRADLVISGGGSLFQDVTSVASVQYYLTVLRLARVLRRKTMIYAQGVGPLTREGTRRAVARTMNRTDLITVRDADSKALLESIGVTKPVHLSADPSFLVEPDLEAADRIIAENGLAGRELLGVSLRPWPKPAGWVEKAAEGIRLASDALGTAVALIPMQEPEDTEICRAIQGGVLLSGAGDPRVVKGLIARCGLVVGMRLHSIIFAAGTGVPFVPVVYDPKVESFAAAAGQTAVPRLESMSAEELRDAIVGTGNIESGMRRAWRQWRMRFEDLALESGRLALGTYAGRIAVKPK